MTALFVTLNSFQGRKSVIINPAIPKQVRNDGIFRHPELAKYFQNLIFAKVLHCAQIIY